MGESLGLPQVFPKAVQGIDLAPNQHGGIGWDGVSWPAAGSRWHCSLASAAGCVGDGDNAIPLGRWHRASGSAGWPVGVLFGSGSFVRAAG